MCRTVQECVGMWPKAYFDPDNISMICVLSHHVIYTASLYRQDEDQTQGEGRYGREEGYPLERYHQHSKGIWNKFNLKFYKSLSLFIFKLLKQGLFLFKAFKICQPYLHVLLDIYGLRQQNRKGCIIFISFYMGLSEFHFDVLFGSRKTLKVVYPFYTKYSL